MGCCSSACGKPDEDDEESEERQSLLRKGSKDELPDKFRWEQDVIDNTLMPSGKLSHAIIVDNKTGRLKAVGPKDYRPDSGGITHIIQALKGDTSGISGGIRLGGGTRDNTPGKLDAGKAIYGSDSKGGGVTIFKTKLSVLIVFYSSDPATATRLASEMAEYMEEQGH